MLEVQIKERAEPGYTTPVYKFVCPMCDGPVVKDLSRLHVRDETWRHMIVTHRAVSSMLDIVVVAEEAFEGMEKVKT